MAKEAFLSFIQMAREWFKLSDKRMQKETQHSHSHVKEEECDEECRIVALLPKELVQNIILRLSTADLLTVQSLFPLLCKEMLYSCELFCNIWDEQHSENWLVLDGVDGFSLLDIGRRQWTNNEFDLQWRSSFWCLRAADGGLLVYSSKHGNLHVMNPLTMKSYQLPDAVFDADLCLSSYLKEHSLFSYLLNCVCLKNTKAPVVEIKLKVDWRVEKVYTVIVVLEDFYQNKIYVLKYKSSRRSWEIGSCNSHLSSRLDGSTIFNGEKHVLSFVGMLQAEVCFLEEILLGRRCPLQKLFKTMCSEVIYCKERILMIAASTYLYREEEYIEALNLYQFKYKPGCQPHFVWRLLSAIEIDKFYRTANNSNVCPIRVKDFMMTCVSGDGEYFWIIPACSEWMASISIDRGITSIEIKWWLNPNRRRKKSWLDLIRGFSKVRAFCMPLKLCPRSSKLKIA